MNWADAERYCRKIGGFLAEIMSEEDEFLLDNFLIGGTSYWLGAVHKLRHFKIDLYGVLSLILAQKCVSKSLHPEAFQSEIIKK